MSLFYSTVSVAISLDVGEDTFSVTCTAIGGTVIASSFTGPGVNSDLQPVGTVGRTGQNTYSAEIVSDISTASDGDVYYCTVTGGLSTITEQFNLQDTHALTTY